MVRVHCVPTAKLIVHSVAIHAQGGGIADEELVWRWGFTTMPPEGAAPQASLIRFSGLGFRI